LILNDNYRFFQFGKPEVEPPHAHAQQSAVYASNGLLATNLPLFPGRLQLSVAPPWPTAVYWPELASRNAAMTKPSSRFPPLLLLFAGSGCSALIYEIVWYQLLQLAVGSTSVSMGVLLATFMGGLCLGSLGLPRYVPPANIR
jgi:hypothetical protein